ncbi:hypothetical protein C8J56DRAFT_23715 [Mycena floridula]|nr:hypothetical protein C8J56DRAFT_23715 [Mycena floridula]
MSSTIPTLADNAVLILHASIIIDAPVEKVWDILLDFPSYEKWNAFVRAQTIIDPQTGAALASQTLTGPGQKMRLNTHLPPTLGEGSFFQKNTTHVLSIAMDPINHRAAWITTTPKFLLYAERWQTLTVLEDGKVKYDTIETFQGILAYFVKWFVGSNLRLAFKAMAEGLKNRAEAQQ